MAIKQIDEAHCVPACLQIIMGNMNPFTQEEIGFCLNTTKDGTDIADVHPFLQMFGLELTRYNKIFGKAGLFIVDFQELDGEDHWAITHPSWGDQIYDPYDGTIKKLEALQIFCYYKVGPR